MKMLTVRQGQILSGLLRGLYHKEIASELGITKKTVANCCKNLYRKLGAFSPREAIKNARQRRLVDNWQQLSNRQRQILDMLDRGLHYKEISAQLGISRDTVSKHCSKLFRKLGATNSREALWKSRGRKTQGASKDFSADKSWEENEWTAFCGNFGKLFELVQFARRGALERWAGLDESPDGKDAEFRLYQIVLSCVATSDAEPLRHLIKAIETPPIIHPLEASILEYLRDRRGHNWRNPKITAKQLAAGLNAADPKLMPLIPLLNALSPKERSYLSERLPPLNPASSRSHLQRIRRACSAMGILLLDGRQDNSRHPARV
jgi:DNA-binding CsgD family transcriptional regulator